MENTATSQYRAAAELQDELIGALISLARASEGNEPTAETHFAMLEGLAAGISFPPDAVRRKIENVRRERTVLIPACSTCASPCGRNAEFDMADLRRAEEAPRAQRLALLFTLRAMSEYALAQLKSSTLDEEIMSFFYEGMFTVGSDWDTELLSPTLLRAQNISLKLMSAI